MYYIEAQNYHIYVGNLMIEHLWHVTLHVSNDIIGKEDNIY